ncbi:MAG: F0F1 ATP synthase subunit A [Thermoguttaceae bacterium]
MADPAKLAEHVRDSNLFELPFGWHIQIPQPFEALGLHLTKFMVLEVVIGLLMLAIFIPLARRVAQGDPPKGRLFNMFDVMLLFIRDKMVRPAIGHDADKYLPFTWTLFFFILFCNLFGLLPWAGSPTAALSVTGALAAITFAVTIGSGMKRFGALKFWLGLCPAMDLPKPMAVFIIPMITCIEILGLLIKHTILAVRLLANMFAGHLVLAVILFFIVDTATSLMWYGVMPISVLSVTALNMLELLFAFIQAYIFAFLAVLFIGMAVHKH